MNWFRLYSEARNDAKLRTLTDTEHRVWFNLLCYAAEQKPKRGVILDYDIDVLAIEVASGDAELLIEVLKKLSRLRIVRATQASEIAFLRFEDRQYDKPSDRPSAVTGRVNKHRANKSYDSKAGNDSNAPDAVRGDTTIDETPSNASKRDETPSNAHTQNRTENTQRIQDPPNPPVPSAQSGSSQAAVLEFAERFRVKHDGEGPHIPDKAAKALIALRSDLGAIKYSEALTGFFADVWASENGHSAAIFTGSSMDRWRHTHPPASKGPPPGKSALAQFAEREEARLKAIFGDFEKGSSNDVQCLQ